MTKFALYVPILYDTSIIVGQKAQRLLKLFILHSFLVGFQLLSAQNIPHPSFKHFTTDDGLPSSEVYFLLQDKEGFIWISTDNGVSRFDGYEFRNYGVKEGLLENVIFEMQLDSIGRLWMQAMSGNLYFMEGDTILPYWHNSVLLNYKNRQDISKGFIVEGSGEKIHIAAHNYGIISINCEGKAKTYTKPEAIHHQAFEKNGKMINALFANENTEISQVYLEKLNKNKILSTVYIKTQSGESTFPNLSYRQIEYSSISIFPLEEGKYFYHSGNNGWLLENGEVLWHHYYSYNFSHLAKMKNGSILGGLPFNSGLRIYQSTDDLQKDKGYTILPEESINYFMEDKEGGRWFATNENGVFYAPPKAFSVHDQETGLSDEKIAALAIKNETELFVGLGNGETWHHDNSAKTWTKLPVLPFKGYLNDLYFDPEFGQLWVSKSVFIFYLSQEKWVAPQYKKKSLVINTANRITSSPDRSRIWLSNHAGFNSIKLSKNPSIRKQWGSRRTHITREDFSGNIWVGQSKGLFEWKDNILHERRDLHPSFSLRVEDIVVMPDSTLVVATKGGGLVFWKDNQFEQITMDQGLTTDMMECLYADENGIVWAGTLNGLNRISGTWNNRKVAQITVNHGLPSNEINRVRAYGDEIWVATNKGLVHFFNTPKNVFSPKPLLRNVLVNNTPIDLNGPSSFHSKENNLTIEFSVINYKMNGKILYRYRLENGVWVQTKSRSLNFPSLPPGGRSFEVQAQNEDGFWSESASFSFVINPPWWKTWWALTLGGGAFLLSGLGFYLVRMGQIKKAHQLQLQIAKLERTALQAQMNPHFIFNCLNSIQNFILQNEKESAIMYLGNFASLVRSMLNASVLGKIPLAEEIKLLSNYLKLEKLRFKNRFDFEIKAAEDLDLFDIEIPPLLVQPYVENAVQHGIAGKEKGGKIVVFFEKESDYITVSIMDNGQGINPAIPSEQKAKSHKSFGMSITQHRLELLSEKNAKETVLTKTLKDESGQILGTQVFIKIKIKAELNN